MTDFGYDAPQDKRPEPDREIMARAHNYLIATETPQQRYVRQQWECAMAATKVALDAWRRIWPIEAADSLSENGQVHARAASNELEEAYFSLDSLAEEMEGVRHEANRGAITIEDIDDMEQIEEPGGDDQA